MPDENANQVQTPENKGEMPASFEAWIEKQDESTKELYENHISGLKNTVKTTRQERDELAKQVREILPKAEKGSAFEKDLTETLAKLEATERRATFAEEAVKPGIDCRNPKAAYAYAVNVDAFDKRGNPDWTLLKKEVPELFGKSSPPAHGGSGTDSPPQANDINSMIRRAAGRQ